MDKNTLLAYQPSYYKTSEVMGNIDTANANELTLLNDRLVDLNNQFYVGTVTGAIERWEKQFGIKVNKSLSLAARRNRILAKIKGQGTSTVQAIKDIALSYVDEVNIIEENETYSFKLDLISKNGFLDPLDGLYETIEEIKPAHIAVNFNVISSTKDTFRFGALTLCGEEIRVFPYQITEIKSAGNVYIPLSESSGAEIIKIGPREV